MDLISADLSDGSAANERKGAEMMVDEFDFFRKVRAYYCNVPFLVYLSYRLSHRVDKSITAKGEFSCRVNPHTQIVEYIVQLVSDPISRPYSEHNSFLFSSEYDEIPQQVISLENHLIYSKRYVIPIDFDWKAFIIEGAEAALSVSALQGLFKKWRLKGASGQSVDGMIKVERVAIDWKE